MNQNKTKPVSRYLQIKKYLADIGEPDFRYKQILQAIFEQNIVNFEKITNIAKPLRVELAKRFSPIPNLGITDKQKSPGAVKIIFKLADSHKIEAVKMTYRRWQSVCVSCQVGCLLGCHFCATGKIGFKRNLSADEITDQVLYFLLNGTDVHSVSFMGMGEPLLNPSVFTAIDDFTNPDLFNFSQRRINVSTVGVVPELEKLVSKFPQVNISFSLHSPFEEQRTALMPISKKYPIEAVLTVLDKHIEKNKRKVFLSYLMIDKVNDTSIHAEELINLIKERKNHYLYHVNLISYHQTSKSDQFQSSDEKRISWFKNELEKARISVSTRYSPGQEIGAACGQLRAS
jgi:23S rRNA (adenine-C8)-methyltransferase